MNPKIKLLVGITEFDMSGAPKLAADIINNLDRNKYELALLSFFQPKDDNNFFDLLPGNLKNYRLNFKGFCDIKNWLETCRILREYRPDIILSNLFFSNTVLRALKPFFGYKVIIYEHNTYTKKKKWQIMADKIFSYFTYKIVAVSETVKLFTADQEKINQNKFAVIPDAIDYSDIQAKIKNYNKDDLKEKLGFKKEDKFIINVAKLWPQKNHKLLIDGFAEFIKRNSGYKLIILGQGPMLDFLTGYVKELNLEDKIFLLGRKKNVFEYMFISEFFVLTSKIEGFAIACIEAMSLGLPVVSTKVAGPDEYVIDGLNGYLVEGDKEDVSRKMQEIAGRGQAYFSENCKVTAQKYDIKENIRKLEVLL
ncbi:MAG: glycosyltransferase [Candidatus Nealsonbacteria bacterium]|nr:glycosyltransferase [Candidatus Nealsonbacteria bacterium]